MVKLKVFRGGAYLGLSRWALNAITHVLIRESQRESRREEGQRDGGTDGWPDGRMAGGTGEEVIGKELIGSQRQRLERYSHK